MLVRSLRYSDLGAVRHLAQYATSEGFDFLRRLVSQVESREVSVDSVGEFFLCIEDRSEIVAIGGLTPDPYSTDPGVGRIRHLYVMPEMRGKGFGRRLLGEIERRGKTYYRAFSLRTDTPAAAGFYEALGYRPIHTGSTTHFRIG